jgi:m7GpppX diphosphatase
MSSSSTATPHSLLSCNDCKVQTLTVSDQHATLLITHSKYNSHGKESSDGQTGQDSNENDSVVQSLMKLTVVPFHKLLLGSNPVLTTSPADDKNNDNSKKPPRVNLLNHNPEASENIISFLKDYDFKLKSESGAEYSYYHATPSTSTTSVSIHQQVDSTGTELKQDKKNTSLVNHTVRSLFGALDVELISPADKRQISRALPSLGSALIEETPDLYNHVVKPYIKSITDGDSLGWIQNVIELKKEKERLLFNCDEFIVNVDTKWRSHPPPLTTPREEWFGHPSCAQDLYCLGIVNMKGIATLRDLRGEHIALLRNIQREGLKAIETTYGVKSDQIRCFVHYQPQFYHFHVHFTRLENEIGSTVEKGHLVTDILQNLEMDPLYYEKRTIVYKLRMDAPLYNLIAGSAII